MLYLKFDVLAALKEKGYSTYKIRRDNIIGQSAITMLNQGLVPGSIVIDTICKILDCQPGDMIGYKANDANEKETD